MKRRIALIAATALFTAFSTQARDDERLQHSDDIHAGQNKTDVSLIMGAPGNREFKGSREAWQYCAKSGLTNKYIIVYFNYGKVEKLMTYTHRILGACDDHFRAVIW